MSLQYFREYKKTLRVCEITYADTIYTQLYGKNVYFYGKLNKAIKIKSCKSNLPAQTQVSLLWVLSATDKASFPIAQRSLSSDWISPFNTAEM